MFLGVPVGGQGAGHALVTVELGLVGRAGRALLNRYVVDLVLGAGFALSGLVVEVAWVVALDALMIVPESVPRALASLRGCVQDLPALARLAFELHWVVHSILAGHARRPVEEGPVLWTVHALVGGLVVDLVGGAVLALGLSQVEVPRHVALYALVAVEEGCVAGAFALARSFIEIAISTALLTVPRCAIVISIVRALHTGRPILVSDRPSQRTLNTSGSL